jgi:tetratricopeptide (TPR) repeat protein
MKRLTKYLLATIFTIATVSLGNTQCATWNDSPKKEDAENAHSIYRQAIKTKDFGLAFENWEIAFEIAPAADGKRDYHFTDGARLYMDKFKSETDPAKKEAYKNTSLSLIDDAIACYNSGNITRSKCTNDECIQKRIGYLAGRKAFDMFYIFNTPYSQTTKALRLAIEKSGNDSEYIVFDPYASIVVYKIEKETMDKAEARSIYEELNAIADYNIENNKSLSSNYQQAKDAMNAKFAVIEHLIFDCDFFVNKLRPEYDASPEDVDIWKKIVSKLKSQNCDASNEFLIEVESKYTTWAHAQNEITRQQHLADNPSLMAKKCYDEGDFNCAVDKYKEAIATETDTEKKASYYFSLASIQYRKLREYGAARNSARKAAKLKANWGRPFMLIGDMYGSSARNCGGSWDQRLAILAAMEKYRYAKSIDSSLTDDANSRLNKYAASMPSIEDGFQRGIKEGQSITVGCWIGESVKVKYKK